MCKPATLISLAAAVALFAGTADAQDNYPTKTIRFIVAASAGGGADLSGRLIAAGIEAELGQKVVVENIAGAGSVAGITALAKSVPDGYTIGTSNISAIGINPHMQKLQYDPKKDLVAISQTVSTPFAMSVRADLPVKTVTDLVDLLKKDPGKYNYGSSGVGILNHMGAELFLGLTGTKATHVPYKSSGDVATAMVQGQVDFSIDSVPVYYPHVQSGKIRFIAAGSREFDVSNPYLKELPLIRETVPDFGTLSSWQGIFAPAGVPQPIIDKLNKAIGNYLRSPAGQEQTKRAGLTPVPSTADELRAKWFREYDTWGKVVESAKIKAD